MKRSLVHRRLAAGPARDYILPWSTVQPGDPVFIVGRVSGRQQDDNLAGQINFLIRQAKRVGAVVIDSYDAQVSGVDPFWLRPAVLKAREKGAKFVIAESTDRLIRPPVFKSTDKCKNLQARKSDLESLMEIADGLTLVTFLDPEASPREVERHRSSRGQVEKGRFGGRPLRKKHRREKLRPRAIEMRGRGSTIREIGRILKVPHTTIAAWLRGVSVGESC